jgi:D-serine deaminase-like pyridoxal phosphate-dependent protein
MAQAAVCRAAGVKRVLLANELVDPGWIDWVLAEIRGDSAFDFLCYVDSVPGVELLAEGIRRAAVGAASAAGASGTAAARTPDVLLEMGHAAGRTGCRTTAQARDVARAAAAAGLRVVGVAGFEGGLGRELSAEVFSAVDTFLESIHSAAADLAGEGLLVDPGGGIIVSAGGSIFFDRAVAVLRRPLPNGRPSRCLIRAGCYVSHDSGEYERLSPFTRPGADASYHLEPALEAWGDVLSLPEPGLAIVGLGRRDVSYDLGLPVPRAIRRTGREGFTDASRLEVIRLNDQHAFVAIPPGTDLALGDWMSFGISHPCTSFDKWRVLPEVDDEYRVVDFIRTYF